MIFASTDLAARIERAESELLQQAATAAAQRRPDEPTLVRSIAGGVAAYSGANSPLNKLAGLGFGGLPEPEALAEVESWYRERGTPLQVELCTLADPALLGLLAERNYRLVGVENILGRELPGGALDPAPPEVDVRACEADELDTWLDVTVTGFSHPDSQGVAAHETYPRAALERAVGDLISADGFQLTLARIQGEIAGAGTMRLTGDLAQLCGAATLPAYRRRGVQTALLTRRLELAREAGCNLVVVTTQPGSKSAQNVQRKGFELLYSRAVLQHRP